MFIRQLGLFVQELEAGPFVFLLSHSIPVAYWDTRAEAVPPGRFRTDRNFNKSTTRHLNKWLRGKEYATIPHGMIVAAFQHISIYTATRAAEWPGLDRGSVTL